MQNFEDFLKDFHTDDIVSSLVRYSEDVLGDTPLDGKKLGKLISGISCQSVMLVLASYHDWLSKQL